MIEAGERITVEAPALSANEALCQRAVSMLGDLEAVHEVTFENDELVVVCSQGEHNPHRCAAGAALARHPHGACELPCADVERRVPRPHRDRPARLSVRHIRRRR